MRAVLKAQINKTNRNDARGIAQMMRVGLYRLVHVKTLRSQKLRMLLTHRKLLQSRAIAIENDLRGTLRSKFVSKQPCLICGRQPADAHHLRFAQHPALGRKVSDEFIVPLCRGHHREVHRSGDEASWWSKAGTDPIAVARTLWTETHQLRPVAEALNRDQLTDPRA